jgi:hypothetical protein
MYTTVYFLFVFESNMCLGLATKPFLAWDDYTVATPMLIE